ncbi:hypothetical protein BC835DRAFT_524344 [Cytidiella melzeri]|nr:hypothetical protein BC835DRAFT_524344 [Cytidiella melzeri]
MRDATTKRGLQRSPSTSGSARNKNRISKISGQSKPGRGRTLEEEMGMDHNSFDNMIRQMRRHAKTYFNPTLQFRDQDEADREGYMTECSKLSELRKYRQGVNCWPAEIYAGLYLRTAKQHHRARDSKLAQAELETRPPELAATGTLQNPLTGTILRCPLQSPTRRNGGRRTRRLAMSQ